MKNETEKRIGEFRSEIDKLIKKYNVGIRAELKVTNLEILPGIVLIDLKDTPLEEYTDMSKSVGIIK
jgi:hypothetical protein